MPSVDDHVPILHCGSKAVQGSRCRTRQDRACGAELRAMAGAEKDLAFRAVVHGALLVRTFVRQRQHACRLPYQQKTPLPEMRHAPDGELFERPHGELSASLPWWERREEEFKEEPQLPAHGDADGRDPAQ